MKITNYFLLVLIIIISSCKKQENEIISSAPTFTPTVMTNLKGIILDKNQDPVSGVNVRLVNNLTSSSSNGLFTFNNISVSENRAMIHFEKEGYFTTSRACQVNNDVSNYIRVVMDEQQTIGNFFSSSGGSLIHNGVNLTFPSSSYFYTDGTEYNGDINVSINIISPEESNFSMRIPGGDLRARTTSEEDMILYSYGMLDVILTDNNNQPLTLNSTTQITFPIPNNLISSAPSEIPLWHYNDETGIWIEEGLAVKNGTSFEGNVSHFSYWNWDVPSQEA